MKVIPESVIKLNRDILKKQNHSSKDMKAFESPVKASACDKLTIESNQNPALSDDQLIALLKKNIMSEIQAGAPERKLDDLRQQIALDEYDVNVPDIVRKMMLDSYEVSYE
jgi:hypothetical protein